MQHSKDSIESTLKFWGPKYQEMGIHLTEEDAIEILDNMIGLTELLYQIEQDNKIEKENI
ncbi:MAG: hypothetical protein KKD05_06520 [Candidatus Omnitrophica bacterium]|nr:hypothetical protein [Candidatus Omnitrophota bacterium]